MEGCQRHVPIACDFVASHCVVCDLVVPPRFSRAPLRVWKQLEVLTSDSVGLFTGQKPFCKNPLAIVKHPRPNHGESTSAP